MKAGVVGAGLMGTGIGLVFALGRHDGLLHDRSEEAPSAALHRIRGIHRPPALLKQRVAAGYGGRGKPGWLGEGGKSMAAER